MPSLEARVLALEGGTRRGGGCVTCEAEELNRLRDPQGQTPPERGRPCHHPWPARTLAEELSELNELEKAGHIAS